MRRFQITDKDKNILTMGQLDKEAAEYFGVEVNDKKYAKPNGNIADWFNTIGWSIASQPEGRVEWKAVMLDVLSIAITCTEDEREFITDVKRLSPYIGLCLYWQNKGYVPYSGYAY